MRTSPIVSIIVPIYGVENYLPSTIESVLRQTIKQFELILVDDGSKDKSGEICDTYAKKDNRIIVIHQQNSGVMSARTTGLKQASGEWVIFLDGDDQLPVNALESFLNATKKTIVDLVCGSMVITNLNKDYQKRKRFFRKGIYPSGSYVKLSGKNPKSLNGLMWRREKLLPEIIIERTITNFEDVLYNIFLAQRVRKWIVIDNPVIIYIQRKASASSNKLDLNYWYDYFQYIENNYKNHDVPREHINNFILNRILLLIYSNYKLDFSHPVFYNIKQCNYSLHHDFKGNITLFYLNHQRISAYILRIIKKLSKSV